MKKTKIVPVILSGGAGQRLWPLSIQERPKQFHPLLNDRTLIQATLDRLYFNDPSEVFSKAILVANSSQSDLISSQTNDFLEMIDAVILEPAIRNTGPALAAAVAHIQRNYSLQETLVLILPADHHIQDVEAFVNYMETGAKAAKDGFIVTFGIMPDRPETGYGYIKSGAESGDTNDVEAFVEKPDLATAEKYIADGRYLWNGGIFLFRADVMKEACNRFMPDIWAQAESSVIDATSDGKKIYLNEAHYSKCENISIDYSVMEKAKNIKVLPVQMGWNDIGSWDEIRRLALKDAGENTSIGDVISIDSKGSYVRADRGVVATIGVDDLIIISSGDNLLISKSGRTQDVKKISAELAESPRCSPSEKHPGAGTMSSSPQLAQRVRSWLFDEALPYWAARGLDDINGGVVERLHLDGSLKPDNYKRLRVLARQIYVFSHAQTLGWKGDVDVLSLINHLDLKGWLPEGGFIHLFNRDGTIKDDTRDCYDQAFVLLGLAWNFRVTGDEHSRRIANKTLDFIDDRLKDNIHGGYHENLNRPSLRGSNCHMHLLEAFLAWNEMTGEERFLERASEIVELFQTHFFDADTWTLTEFFEEDWSLTCGPNARIVMPGHHFEWIWLLVKYSGQAKQDLLPECRKLLAFAQTFGINPKTGMVYDGVDKDGLPVDTNSRCWPQTEALKAYIALHQSGLPGFDERIDLAVELLFNRFLTGVPKGAWMDQFDSNGKPIADTIPASTFYHVFAAFTEFLRHAEGNQTL